MEFTKSIIKFTKLAWVLLSPSQKGLTRDIVSVEEEHFPDLTIKMEDLGYTRQSCFKNWPLSQNAMPLWRSFLPTIRIIPTNE